MSPFQRGDKNIANASGQVVREDMEDTLKATAANNFGPRSSAGTILPAEFVADNSTTPKKLLIRATSGGDQADPTDSQAATFYEVGNLDEANLGLVKKSGDTLTGALQAIAGVVGTPSINSLAFSKSFEISCNSVSMTFNLSMTPNANQEPIIIAPIMLIKFLAGRLTLLASDKSSLLGIFFFSYLCLSLCCFKYSYL